MDCYRASDSTLYATLLSTKNSHFTFLHSKRLTFIVRRYGSTSRRWTKHSHFFESFAFNYDTSPDEREKQVSAQFFRRLHFQKSVQEIPKAFVIDVLKIK